MVDDNQQQKPHILLVTFPAQGHINPSLQFAKRLIRATGARVTFSTAVSANKRISKSSTFPGLTFAPFSDGYDDGFKREEDDVSNYMNEVERRGSETVAEIITSLADKGSHVTLLIYTLLLPWAADVARNLTVPSALLWIQPAAVFDIYYFSFNGYKDAIMENINDPSYQIKLPGLPLLTCQDLPSFFLPSDKFSFTLPLFEKQFQNLAREEKPTRVLVNTFDALEPEALSAVDVDDIHLIGIGPLIPSAFLDRKDLEDTSFGGDLFDAPQEDYIEWLNNREESSVVYVSFGSLSVLHPRQMDELARGLIISARPFLWVVRGDKSDDGKERSRIISYIEKEGIGKEMWKVVSWCSQVEVLNHKSVGCFVTHCGWNSSLEGLVSGVPMVAFPQWSDQGTNAKLIEDVWRVGVRVREIEVDDDEEEEEKGEEKRVQVDQGFGPSGNKVVDSEEVKRCVEIVMGDGERGEELRRNAWKWKELAKEAVMEGGSSERNLKAFVDEFGRG